MTRDEFGADPAIELLRGRAWEVARTEMQSWCHDLPDLLAALATRWQVSPTGESAWAGYEGLAVPVTGNDHGPAVLKATFSLDDRDRENEVLDSWMGQHAARLLERDDACHARLLERLSDESLLDHPDPMEAMQIAGHLAAQLAVEPPPGLPTMADEADRIAEELTLKRATSLSPRDIQAAADTYRDLGAQQPDTLLHGDLHGRNVLRSERDEWAVIDPLGEVGEVALEALSPLRDRWRELPNATRPRESLLDRLRGFADGANASHDRVIAWTHARCVRVVLGGPGEDDGMNAWVVHTLAGR